MKSPTRPAKCLLQMYSITYKCTVNPHSVPFETESLIRVPSASLNLDSCFPVCVCVWVSMTGWRSTNTARSWRCSLESTTWVEPNAASGACGSSCTATTRRRCALTDTFSSSPKAAHLGAKVRGRTQHLRWGHPFWAICVFSLVDNLYSVSHVFVCLNLDKTNLLVCRSNQGLDVPLSPSLFKHSISQMVFHKIRKEDLEIVRFMRYVFYVCVIVSL